MKSSLKNAALTAGGLIYTKTNVPAQYASRQHQFFADDTMRFTEQYAKYSSDYMEAQVQGLDPEDFDKWETCYIRLADVVRSTATTMKLSDNFKRVLFASRQVDYLRLGTKIVTMGSTWLATDPNNISGVGAGGIVQRCTTTWNYLDWYGNVCQEPIAVDRALSRANNTDTQEAMNLAKGYFDVKCQLNEATRQLAENSRMILGRNCYRITGFSDFTQEFTGDYSTVRMLEFSIHFEEPNYTIDDMENHVAGGKQFSWEVSINGQPNMAAGDTAQFTANSRRMNEPVVSTEEHPISYVWSSSDEKVATVAQDGTVTAISPGECVITATLAQNAAQAAQMAIAVAPAQQDGVVKFLQTPPAELQLYESVTLDAAYFYDGVAQDYEVQWAFTGADAEAYTTEVDGNSVTIKCWAGSVTPLTVTASWKSTTEGQASGSVSAEIRLEGM